MPTDHRGLRVALLGPVLVEDRSGALAEPVGVLAKALVAALVGPTGSGAGRAHGVEAIVDAVWGDDRPRAPKPALQTLVSRLRSTVVEGLIASRPGGYALAATPEQTDLGHAHTLGRDAASLARDGRFGEAIGCLDDALALWRGEPGADLGDSPAGRELADAAAVFRLGLREFRARCLLDAGDADAAADELERLAPGHPLDERLQLTRLRALAASGRRAEAFAAFATLRHALRDELGISPGPQLMALHAELLASEASDAAATGAPQRPGPSASSRPARPAGAIVRVGLRAAPNELIGRADEVTAVEALLLDHRLVTILGAGGLGKTRLAQEIAGRSGAPAVVVVELASVRSDDDVVLALASAVGIREAAANAKLADFAALPDLRARLVDQLAERATLLVLDNCEHVIEGASAWASELIASIPDLRVLATSRSPLAIGAEQVYPLEPLAAGTVAATGPAVRLFVERARAARPGAALPLASIARLCERLDGLPLAIELAAARVRSLTVEQIEARLANRFALLTTGDRAAPERQRTLRAVIEWSWALLDSDERAALPRLAWFVDGFGLDAAGVVLARADALDVLERLIDQSLLSVADDRIGHPRYRMLETVREFGQAELDGDRREETLTAIDRWAREFALAQLDRLRGRHQLDAIAELTVEQDNLVAVLRRAIPRRDAATVVAVFASLGYYWTIRSRHSENIAFGEAVLDATRGWRPTADLAVATTLAYAIIGGTNLAVVAPVGLRALARLRALMRRDFALPPWIRAMSGLLLAAPDLELVTRRLDAMVASDDRETALLGNVVRAQFDENDGRPETAARFALRAHDLATALGDVWLSALSAMSLAQLASQSGNAEEALRWTAAARDDLGRLDADLDLQQMEWMLAGALIGSGRGDEARLVLERMLGSDSVGDDGVDLAHAAELGLAELARIEGRHDEAFTRAQRVLAGFHSGRERSSPWFLITLADLIVGGVRAGWPDETVTAWAELLRRRTAGMLRARPDFTDRPVLGTASAGWSAWAVHRPELADRAIELFALAEVFRARQDLPALRLDALAADVATAAGADRLAAARARIAVMTPEAQTRRARELVVAPLRAAPAP